MTACRGALNLKGEHFPCQEEAGHLGWPHRNGDAEAIWVGEPGWDDSKQ